MAAISGFKVWAVDLPLKKPFKHAAAERTTSDSVFVKCIIDSGGAGYGECLPRDYVTGEDRESALAVLTREILPRLVGMRFESLDEVKGFLRDCDGHAPEGWVEANRPHSAAWGAVDLALLDSIGRVFGEAVRLDGASQPPSRFRYSAVLSAETGWKFLKLLALVRLFGFRQVKLKVEADGYVGPARTARRVLGRGCDIRADANMAWTVEQATEAMAALSLYGIRSFEQPIPADDVAGLAQLVATTGLDVMVDESFSDRQSLDRLISNAACTAVNVRISKCGGLLSSLARSREALAAGLKVQIGCQVGESSLLSAAHLVLTSAVGDVRYGEACYGLHLLKEDPATPVLQFGYGGKPPDVPRQSGLGVSVDESTLSRFAVHETVV